jgi:hypothetical protein
MLIDVDIADPLDKPITAVVEHGVIFGNHDFFQWGCRIRKHTEQLDGLQLEIAQVGLGLIAQERSSKGQPQLYYYIGLVSHSLREP